MTDEDKEFLRDLIERQIMHYTDFTGIGADGYLATRIANAIEAEFAQMISAKQKEIDAGICINEGARVGQCDAHFQMADHLAEAIRKGEVR